MNVEQEILDKGLTAARVTPERIEQVIKGETYYRFPDTTVTICLLTLANGFSVTGESACASPENFDEEIGKKIAKDNAKNKIWALEGYTLCNILSQKEEIMKMLADPSAAKIFEDLLKGA